MMSAADAITPIRLNVTRKSDRGHSLVDLRDVHAIKAEPVVLAVDMTAAKAFQVIAQSCVRQFRLNEALLIERDNVDALHQARVALRRLRTALTLFKLVLKDAHHKRLSDELKWMTVALGVARNIDVFVARFKSEPLPKALRVARRNAYVQARTALDSSRWRTLMLELMEWLDAGDWLTRPDDPSLRDELILHRAEVILDHHWKRLKRRGRGLVDLGDHPRHQLRIEVKRLRYAVEFFGALYTDKKSTRHKKAFGDAIESLQDILGELNDLTTEPALLAKASLPEVMPARTTIHARKRNRLLSKAEKRYAMLLDVKRFWR